MKKILIILLILLPFCLQAQWSYFNNATVNGTLYLLDSLVMAPRVGIIAPTNFWGTEINNLSFNFSDAGDRSVRFVFRPPDGLSMRAYSGDDYTQDSSEVRVDSNLVFIAVYDGGAIKGIIIDTSASGFIFRDDDAGKGPIAYGDYTSGFVALSYTHKGYQDTHLGSQQLNSTIYDPGPDEHYDFMVWDSLNQQYITINGVPVGQAKGPVTSVIDTVLFSNTTVDTIVTLPVGALILDIQVCIVTTFDGSGTNLLDVGIIGDTDRYENDLDLEVTAPKIYGLANLSDRITATTHIIFQYFDSGADVSTGLAIIYVIYIIT